jgi:hypothetical protein
MSQQMVCDACDGQIVPDSEDYYEAEFITRFVAYTPRQPLHFHDKCARRADKEQP